MTVATKKTPVIHLCTQCHDLTVPKARMRCDNCKKKYDANGHSFIIASDIYRFYKRGRIVYIWVCDGKVNQIKAGAKSNRSMSEFDHLAEVDHSTMMDDMKAHGFQLQNISYATIK